MIDSAIPDECGENGPTNDPASARWGLFVAERLIGTTRRDDGLEWVVFVVRPAAGADFACVVVNLGLPSAWAGSQLLTTVSRTAPRAGAARAERRFDNGG